MEYLFIYALQIADGLSNLFCLLLAVLIIVSFLKFAITFDDNEIIPKELKTLVNKSFVIIISVLMITFIFPCKQNLLLWGGTYYGKTAVNKVINTDKYKKISELIDLKLDSLIQDERNKK